MTEKVKLNEITDIYLGVTHTPEYVLDGVPFLSVKDISGGKICFDDCKFISQKEYNSLSEGAKPKVGDMLFCRVGTIGKPIIIPEGTPLFGSFVSLGYLRNKAKDRCNLNYLRYWMYSNSFWKQVNKNVKGASQVNLNTGWLSNFEIRLPDFSEQTYIVSILDKCKLIIERREEELKKFDNLIRARFVEMFGDVIHNDKVWEKHTVESLCKEIYGGGTPSKSHPEYYESGDIPWVSSKDMKSDVLTDSQVKINRLGLDNSTAKMVPMNSVIMVIRSGILKHTLPVAINAVPITVNQDLKVFIPGERVLTRFLAVQFKMHEKDILSGVRAVTADNIEFDSLKQRELIVPPIELQHEYVFFLEQIDKSKFEVQKALDKAQLLFDSLMQKYFG